MMMAANILSKKIKLMAWFYIRVKDICKIYNDEYGVTSPTDITNALKDLLGETLQDMLTSEFDERYGIWQVWSKNR